GVEVPEVQDLLVAVGVGHLEEPVLLGLGVHPQHGGLDHRRHARLRRAAVLGQVVLVQRQIRLDVLAEDVLRRLRVRALDLDLHVEPARPQDRRVDHVLAVGGANDDDVLQALHTVNLGEQLRDDGVLHVRGDARAPSAEHRVHLVEEDDNRRALARLLASPLEDEADVPLSLADVLVEQLRALDVEEVAAALLLALLLGDLLRQRVGDRLRDERLATAGWAVQQHALRRTQLVLPEQVRVQEWKLDGVPDLLDLPVQTPDVGVVDVGDLLKDELLDLALGDALVRVRRARLDQQRVAGPKRCVDDGVGELDHALLIGVRDDQRPVTALEHLLEHDDLADPLEAERIDDVESIVEQHLLAAAQRLHIDRR